MSPSSLVFVLIVVVWAAFLLQHWIRRREALVTARSVDRFSAGMRVLHRRERGEVHMTQDAPQRTSLRAGSTTVAPRAATGGSGSHAVELDRHETNRPALNHTDGDRAGAGSHAVERPAGQVRLGGRVWRLAGRVTGRQVRAAALLLSLVLLVGTVLLTPLGATPWWSPVIALGVTVGVVVWLRAAAVHERSYGRVHRATPAAAGSTPAAPVRETAPARSARPVVAQAPVETAPLDVAQPAPRVERDSFYDAQAVEAQFAAPAPAKPARVVPPPVYTMKARAQPDPAAVVTHPLPDATPVDQLPFDGLALDEELEELPAVYRAS